MGKFLSAMETVALLLGMTWDRVRKQQHLLWLGTQASEAGGCSCAGTAPATQEQLPPRDVPASVQGLRGTWFLKWSPTPAVAAPPQRRVCCSLAQCRAGSRAGSTRTGGKENGTGASRLRPNVPLCLTLEQLLVPARSPVQAIYSPGTSLLTRSSVLLCHSSASLSHALSQALAAPSVGKVHLNPIPTWNRTGKGVWCWDRWAMWNHQAQACFGLLGGWETCGQGYLNVCLGEPSKVLQRSINTGPAARQRQGEDAVGPTAGAKTEPSLFLTVPAVQFTKEV